MKRQPLKSAAKRRIEDLALFGGPAAFPEMLHVGRPNLGDRDQVLRRFERVLDSRWYTNDGPMVRELEARIQAQLGVRHCVAMSNGTVALEIAARALGLSDEVIVPSFTFVATAHCLQWQEITPVFCDIDPMTHNLDPARVEALITPRTTGIIGVHLWGRPCDVNALQSIAEKHALRMLFDASHAYACSYDGRMVGGFGDAETLSFHATKFVSCGEGGAVVTNSDDLAEKMRLMRNFGFRGMDTVDWVGTNGKMGELPAAMGLSSLEAIDRFVEINRRNHQLYRDRLAGTPGLTLVGFDERESQNYQYVVVEVDETEAGLARDDIMRLLLAERVRARRYFWPGCHRMEPYRSYFPNAGLLLPATEEVAARVLVLPTGESASEEDVDGVCALLRFLVENCAGIRQRLREHA